MKHAKTIIDTNIIYRHNARADWGDAILAWDRGGKRGYMFEDGKLRVFKDGWYHHLSEVDQPLPKAAATAARLQRKLGLDALRRPIKHDGMSFEDQLTVFEMLYPQGFTADGWAIDKRGEGAKRRLKRHRDIAIADARERLDAGRLDVLITADHIDEAWGEVIAVLDGTDLVTKRHVAGLRELGTEARRSLVECVRGLLWGDESYEVRFERFVATLALLTGKEPSWQLATVLSALVHPDQHIAVRPNIMRAQAAWMAPNLAWSKVPTAPLYTRLQRMAEAVREELRQAEQAPRDLLDVADFMWTTLRPKARKLLEETNSGIARIKKAA